MATAVPALMVLLAGESICQAGGQSGDRSAAEAAALFTNAALHVIRIEIPPQGMRSLEQEPRKFVHASFREGAAVFTNVLIRLKGGAGSFRGLDDKPGFTLHVDAAGHTFYGLKKFHLNNSVQDPTYLSEWLCSGIFRDAGVPAARAAHAVVELNGRRLGQYVLVESIASDFLAGYFKHTHGNVYGQSPNADITGALERMGGREQTQGAELEALAAAASEPELERLRARLPQVLDIPRFLSFMAVEVMLDHWDGYTFNVKNYEVYHDPDTARMVFIPHDLDQLMRNPNSPVVPHPNGIVARAILRDPQTRTAYRRRFGEIFTNVFVAPVLIKRVDDRVARVAPQLTSYDPELAREFVNNAEDLKQRIAGRARWLARQLQAAEPARPSLLSGSAPITTWRVANEQRNAKQDMIRDPSGKKVLWITAEGPSFGSWRAKLALEPGHYVFEGRARSVGIEPNPDDAKGAGAGLRISGSTGPQTSRLIGDSPWRSLTFEFEVYADTPEVDLICELRAQKGEVWFEQDSLRLRRLR
jgi:hypothetical protein